MDSFSLDIGQCLEVLKLGGTILYPTDTLWGIGCDATNSRAVEKIFHIKKRPIDRSLIVLVGDERDLLQYVAAPDLQIFDFLDTVKKPTTVIYEGVIGLAANALDDRGRAGIRVVKEEFCRHLIKRFRKPIISTSANISGQPAPAIFREISSVIKDAVDYIVQYRQDDTRLALPSSVIKWENGKVDVIRP